MTKPDQSAPPAVRLARRRVAPQGGYGGMHRMPSAGVKAAAGGRGASRAFSLDARVPGGAKPPRQAPRTLAATWSGRHPASPSPREIFWGASPPRDPGVSRVKARLAAGPPSAPLTLLGGMRRMPLPPAAGTRRRASLAAGGGLRWGWQVL